VLVFEALRIPCGSSSFSTIVLFLCNSPSKRPFTPPTTPSSRSERDCRQLARPYLSYLILVYRTPPSFPSLSLFFRRADGRQSDIRTEIGPESPRFSAALRLKKTDLFCLDSHGCGSRLSRGFLLPHNPPPPQHTRPIRFLIALVNPRPPCEISLLCYCESRLHCRRYHSAPRDGVYPARAYLPSPLDA